MITVVVPGSENENCAKELCCILEKFGGALFASKDSVLDFSAAFPAFFVFNTDTVRSVTTRHRLLLLPGNTKSGKIAKDCRFDRIIADGLSKSVCDDRFLTVGTGRNNCISIASADRDTLQISVQDILHTLDGAEILPCEFSVQFHEASARTALYAFTVLLLAGKADISKLQLQL